MPLVKTAFPLLQVDSPSNAARFYTEHFGFEPVFESEWYSQIRSGTQEIAFIRTGHDSIPQDRHGESRNVCLTLEVDDVDSTYDRVRRSMHVVTRPRDEEWGQRHFLGYDPSGIMLDIMTMLENDAPDP